MMEVDRADVASVMVSFLPELSDQQVAELEMTVFNATVRAQTEAGVDAIWGDAFKAEYKRLAAAITANLTGERGFSNGNTDLMRRVLRGDLGVQHVVAMCPSSIRPEVFAGMDTEAERLSKVTLRNTGTVSTLFECPKCAARNCSYTELQTRSGDEGTTIFLFCHSCSTRWTQGG